MVYFSKTYFAFLLTLTSVVIQFISQSLLLLLVGLDIVCSFSLGLLIPVKSDLPESLHHPVDRDQR